MAGGCGKEASTKVGVQTLQEGPWVLEIRGLQKHRNLVQGASQSLPRQFEPGLLLGKKGQKPLPTLLAFRVQDPGGFGFRKISFSQHAVVSDNLLTAQDVDTDIPPVTERNNDEPLGVCNIETRNIGGLADQLRLSAVAGFEHKGFGIATKRLSQHLPRKCSANAELPASAFVAKPRLAS